VLQDYRLHVEEYQEYAAKINATAADTYRYLNFHKMPHYTHKANKMIVRQTVV
jgi:aconitate hydratase 2/2-methylisocitrate dehydratase